jgi:Tfp pilus assembly protein PilX
MFSFIRRHIRGLQDRIRPEEGIALPVAVALLFIITTLSAAALAAATTANGQAGKDRSAKRAIAAADAGTDTATYRLNKLKPSDSQCVVVTDASTRRLGLEDTVDGYWCREQTEDLGDGASYRYKITRAESVTSNGQSILQRTIVSIGTVNGVQRRTLTRVASLTGRSLLGDYAVISDEDMRMPNTTRIDGNTGTNGNIDFYSPNAKICGDVTYGKGKRAYSGGSPSMPPPPNNGCTGESHSAYEAVNPFVLTPIAAPCSPAPASCADNARLNPGGGDPRTSINSWDPNTRVLKLGNFNQLTLTGNTYVFCYLEITNTAQLIIGARASSSPLRIYIDSPENCPGVPNAGSVTLANNALITNSNTDPNTFQLFVVGSPDTSRPTTVGLNNSFLPEISMVIYAPRSTVSIQNAVKINGGIAAKKVVMENSSRVTYSNLIKNLSLDGLDPLFQRQSWNECTPVAPPNNPLGGCSS